MAERLTLYSRRGFVGCGPRRLEAACRDRHRALLFYFDVDNLKSINDTAGHAAGDAVLVQTAQVLRGVFRNRDVVGRLGGDEFAVLASTSDPAGSGFNMKPVHPAPEAANAAHHSPPPSLSVC